MSYTPTEWQPDDVVTAARMNSLETAVGEINMSYTPNTWVNGEVITAAKMNALEQAVAAGGGGGGGDFSTVSMTISGFPSGFGGGVSIGGFVGIEDDMLMPVADESNYQNGEYDMVLYQGTGYVYCYESIIVSGDAEYDGNEGIITVTGDFTISPSS